MTGGGNGTGAKRTRVADARSRLRSFATDDGRGRHVPILSIVLTLALIVSAVAPFVLFAAPVDAASPPELAVTNAASGETTTHTWRVFVAPGTTGTLRTLRLNYTGTGADPSVARPGELSINGSAVSVAGISRDGDFLNITLGSARTIDGSEQITAVVRNVTNPSSAGTYTATLELDNGSGTFYSSDRSIGIVQGGYVNGTVTDASASALSGATVSVTNGTTGTVVTSAVTDATGTYATNVPADTYDVEIGASGYGTVTKPVTVSTGVENTTDATLQEVGYVNGTITDGDGAVSGAPVVLVDSSGGSVTDVDSTTTDASGTYSLTGPSGTYDVVVPSDDHEFEIESDVGLTAGSTVTHDIGVTKLPGDGTITGTVEDANGNPVTSGRIAVRDDTYTHFNSTTLGGSNTFSLQVPAGTYQLRANVSGAPIQRVSDVDVSEGGTTDVTVTLSDPAYLDGTVTNASGPVPNTLVVADNGDRSAVGVTDASGTYNITVPPGDYTVSVFANGQDAASVTATARAGTATTNDFTLQATEILAQDVTKLSGPGDASKIEVRTGLRSGMLQLQLVNASARPGRGVGRPSELEALGVDNTTEFEITVTVTNFTANSLLWGLRDAEMTTSDNATVRNATDVTIRGSPVTLQATFSAGQGVGPLLRTDPSDVNWPTGRSDRADDGFNDTVYVGVFDLSSVPASARTRLNGMSVTTNAQRFSAPKVENDSLRVWVAGPSKTVGGADHDGFYQATIPDAQLDEWGVDDPVTDLRALYKGQQRDFSVTDTAGGARIVIDDIDYSAGFVEIEPDASATGGGGSGSSGGGDGGPAGASSRLVDGRARLSFGAGADVRSVELVSPGATGEVTARERGRLPDDVPDPGGLLVERLEIDAPDPSAGAATVAITLSDALLDRHVVGPSELSVRRYDAATGEWVPLDTTYTDVAGGIRLEVETDEFSVFAVGRFPSHATATPTPTPTPRSTATTVATTTGSDPGAVTSTPTAPPTTGRSTGTPHPTAMTTTPSSGGAAGFGPVVALLALVLATALAVRRD